MFLFLTVLAHAALRDAAHAECLGQESVLASEKGLGEFLSALRKPELGALGAAAAGLVEALEGTQEVEEDEYAGGVLTRTHLTAFQGEIATRSKVPIYIELDREVKYSWSTLESSEGKDLLLKVEGLRLVPYRQAIALYDEAEASGKLSGCTRGDYANTLDMAMCVKAALYAFYKTKTSELSAALNLTAFQDNKISRILDLIPEYLVNKWLKKDEQGNPAFAGIFYDIISQVPVAADTFTFRPGGKGVTVSLSTHVVDPSGQGREDEFKRRASLAQSLFSPEKWEDLVKNEDRAESSVNFGRMMISGNAGKQEEFRHVGYGEVDGADPAKIAKLFTAGTAGAQSGWTLDPRVKDWEKKDDTYAMQGNKPGRVLWHKA